MTTLGAALNSFAQQLRVDAAVADPADYYKIDSEVVQLLSHRQASAAYLAGDPTLWRVERGVAGTTAASHLNGATLTALYPQIALSPVESAGGGGVSVEVPPAAPVAVSNIIAPGADISGGTADLSSVLVARQLRADVAFDSPGMDDIAPLFTVPAGALVLRILAFVTSAWNVTGGTISDYPANSVNFGAVTSMDNPAALLPGIESDDSFNFPNGSWLFAAEQGIGFDPTGLPSGGTMTVIAIIATPAS